MALFTQDDLKAFIPEAYQEMAMDDDGIGMLDETVFASILQACLDWITGYLEQAGLTLDDPAPRRIKVAAMRYAEYMLWDRRGHFEKAKACYDNWIKPAMVWLDKIATGAELIVPPAPSDETIASVLTEPARTFNPDGGLMI